MAVRRFDRYGRNPSRVWPHLSLPYLAGLHSPWVGEVNDSINDQEEWVFVSMGFYDRQVLAHLQHLHETVPELLDDTSQSFPLVCPASKGQGQRVKCAEGKVPLPVNLSSFRWGPSSAHETYSTASSKLAFPTHFLIWVASVDPRSNMARFCGSVRLFFHFLLALQTAWGCGRSSPSSTATPSPSAEGIAWCWPRPA